MAESPTQRGEGIQAPVELVIADDPGVVGERVEAADHGRAARAQADFGALVNVADVEEERVGIGALPLADLRGATGQSAEVGVVVVIDGGQDVAVEVGGVENGDGDGIGLARPKRSGQCGEQGPLPEQAQEPAPAGRRHVDVHGVRLWELRMIGHKEHRESRS